MTWLAQLLSAALTVGTALGQQKLAEIHPLKPWQEIGAVARVYVINASPDSVLVTASAPDVDDASRRLGVVPPCSQEVFRLPYADTDVRLRVGDRVVVIPVYKPAVTWVQASRDSSQVCS